MPELKGNGHFQIFKAIFGAVLANRPAEIESRQSPSNETPSVGSHSVEPRPSLHIAHRVDHPQQGLADRLRPGKSEHAAFKPAHSMG
jgi:hypothetical protein